MSRHTGVIVLAAAAAVLAASSVASIARAAPPKQADPAPSIETAERRSREDVADLVEKVRLGYDLAHIAKTHLDDLASWRVAAGRQNTDAQLMLGLCNYYGIGGPQNETRGRELILAAANAKNAEAMAVQSLILRSGDYDTRPDPDGSNDWLARALAAHSKIAVDALPVLAARELLIDGKVDEAFQAFATESDRINLSAVVEYANLKRLGWIVPFDIDGSTALLKRAAEAGHIEAMLRLADTYADGRYERWDPVKARQWYDAAIATGDARAMYWGVLQYERGSLSSNGMPDHASANALWAKLEADGTPYAAFALHFRAWKTIHSDDPNLPALVDQRVLPLLEDASRRGVPEAFVSLATMARAGTSRTIGKDLKRSADWLDDGVNAGSPDAFFDHANSIRYGWYVPADEDKAREIYFAAARLGVPQAMASVGFRYITGRGVPIDLKKGHLAYLSAALAGDTNAMVQVSADYLEGLGTNISVQMALDMAEHAIRAGDPDGYFASYNIEGGRTHNLPLSPRALQLLSEGARRGSVSCQNALGLRMIAGDGVPADVEGGLKILEGAAAADIRGDVLVTLGNLYSMPESTTLPSTQPTTLAKSVPHDAAKAKAYFQQAMDRNNANAFDAMAHLYLRGDGVEKDQAQAVRLLQRAVELGSKDAGSELAILQQTGDAPGLPKDASAAVAQWKADADHGSSLGAINYGIARLNGRGVAADEEEGLRYLNRAIELGDARAAGYAAFYFRDKKDYAHEHEWLLRGETLGDAESLNGLGVEYRFGNGVPEDLAKASQYYKRAADAGSVKAKINYAWCLETGTGVAKDPAASFHMIQSAAEANDPDALLNLGRHYIDGVGTTRDLQEGLRWVKRAAEAGNPVAQAMYDAAKARGLVR